MSDHPCAVADCTSPAKAGQLMCLACWRRTPARLQMAVNKTWRSYKGRRAARPAEALERVAAYRAARDAAVRWHADNPPAPQRRRRSSRALQGALRL